VSSEDDSAADDEDADEAPPAARSLAQIGGRPNSGVAAATLNLPL
jgi:hypothetical protein